MPVALITHPVFLLHETPDYHPECAARIAAISDRLIASGIDFLLRHHEAPPATREQLERVHDPAYIDTVERMAPPDRMVTLDGGDTVMGPHSLDAAYRAAGAAVLGTDLVMRGEADAAFCLVRPPGHHAGRDNPAGFCIFNNVAVGAAHALDAHGLERIAIADFDVHHGNGTEEIFRDDPRVLYLSTFRHPYYPGCGADTGSDHIVNVPLRAGAGSEDFRRAVEDRWLPALEDFRPQFLFISAGFDAHSEDDMGGLRLVEADYAWVTRELADLAARHARRRIVSCLEGGYHLPALARSVQVHIEALMG